MFKVYSGYEIYRRLPYLFQSWEFALWVLERIVCFFVSEREK